MKVETMPLAGTAPLKGLTAAESIQGERVRLQDAPASTTKKVPSEEIWTKIKALTEDGLYSVRFEVDEGTRQLVVRLVDAESGEVLRQIPPEELLELSERLRELRGNLLDTST